MAPDVFTQATASDVSRLGPELVASGHFTDVDALRACAEETPWRIGVSDRDEIVLMDRWRDHLPLLAIEGVWCEPSRVPALVAGATVVARERGFARVLSPLVVPAASRPYQRAGMEPYRHVRQMRRRALIADVPPPEWRVASGPVDPAALLALEKGSFEGFWRLDERHLRTYLRSERVSSVSEAGRTVGYAFCSAHAATGSIGRLAVHPEARGRGIGRALVSEAIAYLASEGVRDVVINTQADNVEANALYRSEGFREMPERLVTLVSATL